jgi:indolepyruvate ferredoxin oxidoreductase, beta subunit
MSNVTNIVVAGLGGQGVLTACAVIADAAFRMGHDVRKAEVHGMSRRGGSVACDVRFGDRVWSPMVPAGEADFLLAFSPDQGEANRWRLRPGGTVIDPSVVQGGALHEKRALNVALLGVLSGRLDFPQEVWLDAIRAKLPEKLHSANLEAFRAGRFAYIARLQKPAE